jgi:LDH2 family malate/lactate/ureidoglycolate dehydrogenase
MKVVGANETNGSKVADLLIVADQRGHYSHGMNRLRIYMEDCKSKNCGMFYYNFVYYAYF